jgi:hypothetical protein
MLHIVKQLSIFGFVLVTGLGLVSADGSVTRCVWAGTGGLQNALAQGGSITFQCSGTIVMPETTISINTTLDASGRSVTLSGNGTSRLFRITPGISLTFNHLTLTKGSYATNESGGAIYNDAGTLTVIQSTFTNNVAFNGGAIYNAAGTVAIQQSSFSNNSAAYEPGSDGGGAIYNTGTLNIDASTFTNNRTGLGGGGMGGAIYSSGVSIIQTSRFIGNYGNQGAGIYNSNVMTVTENQFSMALNFQGGAVFNAGKMHFLYNSVFNNRTTYGPGIYNTDTVDVVGSAFYNNLAPSFPASGVLGGGSGIVNDLDGLLSVSDTTFANNTSENCGVILMQGGPASSLTMENVTFAGNASANPGSGLCGSIEQLLISNTLMSGKAPTANCELTTGAPPTATFNLSTDATCGAGFTTVAAAALKLGPLADNGGPSKTLALLPGSIAIDRGTCAAGVDQRGQPRPINLPTVPDTDGSGDGCDVGAFEVQQGAKEAPVINYDTSGTPTISWSGVSWASGYLVQVARYADFSDIPLYDRMVDANTLKLKLDAPPLDDGVYYWRVCARKDESRCNTWGAVQSLVVNVP